MAKDRIQQGLFSDIWITTGLFSNHYLLERLPQAGSTVWPSDEKAIAIYRVIQELYERNIVGLRKGNEANTERRFIDKVFNELGFGYLNQTKIPEAEHRQVPDYFLYSTQKDAGKAFESSSHERYRLAISIAESKRWDHNLDQPSSGKGKAPQGRYPHQQIRDYLNESEHIRWGILTNGKEWRLYFKEGRLSKFFEIDLEGCLKDFQKFKYFYTLFRPGAFIKDSLGKCLLDNIFEQSLRFQEDVEKDLREKVFKCVEWLGQEFLFREENQLTEKDLDSIYHYSLILLYRILFVLNAEARDLLPTNPQTKYYKHYGIQRIKDRIRQEKGEFIGAKTTLYDELLALFHLINGDNEKLNRDLRIPRYNGGLFDPEIYSFLEEKKVGDDVLSEVIYELSYRTDKNGEEHSIDYKGLGERHLGTVYEGLLEHKFTFDNGKIVLQNDKGERKATGAYYTPDYIVKYIIENTLGPILKEIDEKLISSIPTLEIIPSHPPLLKGGRGDYKDDSFAREILKLNICDPAMGSGHFLVEAVQYLAEEISYHPTTQLKTPKGEAEDEVNYWKRKVVESCIYGVDIKGLAVELAKLSLWLKTVDRSQPLNFLDHHLRCGNSLIGAGISDLNYLPQTKGKKKSDISDEQLVLFDTSKFKEDITAIVRGFQSIEEMPSEKLSDIKAKEKTFKNLMGELNRYREIADLWTSLFFGNSLEEKGQVFEELLKDQYKFQLDIFGPDTEVTIKRKAQTGMSNRIYNFIVAILQSPDGKAQISKLRSLLENSESIAKDRKFFHWELEFPEVFFNEDGSTKGNPGFDCVIGNPPYDVLSELEQGRDVETEKQFFSQSVRYRPAIGNKLNFYRFFSVLSLNLLKAKAMHGFIVPMALLADKQAKPLREFMLKKNRLHKIEAFPQKDDPTDRVFPEAKLSTCVYILRKEKPSSFLIRIHPGKDILEVSTSLSIKPSQIEEFDKENLSIPSYPNMTAEDFYLALKMKRVSKGVMLKQFAPSQQGEVNLTEHSKFLTDEDNGPIILRGAHINRYEFQEEPKQGTPMYLDVKRFLDAHGKNTKAYDYQYIRIGYQRGSAIDNWRRIIATIIGKENFCSDTINYIVNPKEYNLFTILALLNSSLWEWRFRLTSTNNHVNSYEIDSMPMPFISFTTPRKEGQKRVSEAIRLYQTEIKAIARNADKWQNKNKEERYDKNRDKKGSAKSRKVAERPRRYKLSEEGISREDPGLGGEVYGIREGACEYEPPEGTPQEGEGSTHPLNSTRHFETAQGIKTYSEVSEILAVSVTKTIEAIIDKTPEDIHITPEWICELHSDIAGALFSDWAGRFRDVNVKVGTHIPPPYYEVPVHTRLYCDDLTARLSFALKEKNIEKISETLAYVDWRFQWIHPFKDFNGRVGRIILTAVLFKLKLPPAETASVEPEEKEKYLNALRVADKGDISLLTEIWIERLSKAFRETEGK